MARATSRLAALTLVVLAPGRAEGASACKDLNDYCADWAARGECEANPGYMLVMCPAACGACGAEPTTQPPPASSCNSFDGMRADADLAGDLVAKVKGQSAASCCGACDATAGCEGFSYLPPYCYLKANLTGTFPHEGCSTRLRATPTDCSGFGALREGVDLAGELLGTRFASDAEHCCSGCKALSGCQGFSYFEQHCYYKASLQGTFPKVGCQVRLRAGPAPAAAPASIAAAATAGSSVPAPVIAPAVASPVPAPQSATTHAAGNATRTGQRPATSLRCIGCR